MNRFVEIEKRLSWVIAIIPVIVAAILFFFILPDTVPHHINSAGEVTRTGGKWIIFLLPAILLVISFGVYILFHALSKAELKNGFSGETSPKKLSVKKLSIIRLVIFLVFLVISGFYFAAILQTAAAIK